VVAPEASEAEQVLCLKRRGALVVRDPACKSSETPFDLTSFVSAARGTVAGYATIDADGSVIESFSQVGATVTASRNQVGAYSIAFGFDVRPDQAILLSTRETFGIELCRVFQGASPRAAVDVFCATAEPGSPAADVAFTVVVLD
jgi:hypothetical protein